MGAMHASTLRNMNAEKRSAKSNR